MDVDILRRSVRICALVVEVGCATQHGQNDRERVLRIIEGHVQDRACIYDTVYSCIVVGTYRTLVNA